MHPKGNRRQVVLPYVAVPKIAAMARDFCITNVMKKNFAANVAAKANNPASLSPEEK